MSKFNFSILCVLTLFSNYGFGQTLHWESQVGNTIFDYKISSDNLIVIYGESNGDKVVKSNRIFPDVVALNKFSGEKEWEIKKPIEMMGASSNKSMEKVKMELIDGTDYVRFGHLLIVNSKDGSILFNPTNAGITRIMHSKIFPEGILANVKLKGKTVQLFLSFTSFNIEWTKKDEMDKSTNKSDETLYEMMSNDPNVSLNLPVKAKSSHYNGYYHDGNYIVQFFREIVSFDIKTGMENWKYKSKKFFTNFKISENEKTNNAVIFFSTQKGFSAAKNVVSALNITSGKLLWKNDVDYSISKLITIDETASVLIEPRKSIGKRHLQVYNSKGQTMLHQKSLKMFGNGIEHLIKDEKGLIVIAGSGNSIVPASVDVGFTKIALSKRGGSTKFLSYVNIIDLDTKQFVFEKNIKTGDDVRYIKSIDNGLLIIENNQAYSIDYKTGIEKEKPLTSKTNLVCIIDDENAIYIAPENASGLYKIDASTGLRKQIIDLKKASLNITFIKELFLINDEIILYGLTNNEDLAFVRLNLYGDIVYANNFSTPSYQKSWQMPIIGKYIYQLTNNNNNNNNKEKKEPSVGLFDLDNGKITNSYSYFITIASNSKENIGDYYINDGIIYHVPIARKVIPFDKKAITFNNKGIIVAKRF